MGMYEFDEDYLLEKERPFVDLTQDKAYLTKGYSYRRSCSDETKEFIKFILRMSGDQFCNSCYAMRIEKSAEVESRFI